MSRSRSLQRFFFSGAAKVETDGQGRILIPSNLREYAALDKDVMVIGASIRAEIWDKHRWDEENTSLTSDMIAEAMNEIGF